MTTLIFATNNVHKVQEVKTVIGSRCNVISLAEAGIDIEIPEPYDTLQANATEKCRVIYELTGKDCFSEDTGLEVFALGGEPGVKSARYAGEGKSSEDNIKKLLQRLHDVANRQAQFRTVISLFLNGKEYQFEGICKGTITLEPRGISGFGYDPVFIPEGSNLSFAEMSMDQKNEFSHRRKATDALIAFLNQQ